MVDKEKITIIILGTLATIVGAIGMLKNLAGWETIVSTVAGGLLGYLKASDSKEKSE